MTKYEIFLCEIPAGTPPKIREELIEDYCDELSRKGWTVLNKTPKGESMVINCKKEGSDGF